MLVIWCLHLDFLKSSINKYFGKNGQKPFIKQLTSCQHPLELHPGSEIDDEPNPRDDRGTVAGRPVLDKLYVACQVHPRGDFEVVVRLEAPNVTRAEAQVGRSGA